MEDMPVLKQAHLNQFKYMNRDSAMTVLTMERTASQR